MSLATIHAALSKHVTSVFTLITDFAIQQNLEDDPNQPNPFYEYLTVGTSTPTDTDFNLGTERFVIRAKFMAPKAQLKLYHVVRTLETPTGVKEIETNLSVEVNLKGEIILNNQPLPPDAFGPMFFATLQNQLANNSFE